jgi:hypothetical protein
LKPLRQSNFSTACIRPRFPSWMRSSRGRPEAWYFLAIDTTSRRFDWTKVCWACSPVMILRFSSRRLDGVRSFGLPAPSSCSASRPASIVWARRTSSSLVSNGYCPMSVRYSRTRSSSSRSTRSFANVQSRPASSSRGPEPFHGQGHGLRITGHQSPQGAFNRSLGRNHQRSRYRLVMGIRRSLPKALAVIRTPGGDCRRLYSAPSTKPATRVPRSRVESLAPPRPPTVLLHQRLRDRIEDLVGGKALVVALTGPQLGRRRLLQNGLGDEIVSGEWRCDIGTAGRRGAWGRP